MVVEIKYNLLNSLITSKTRIKILIKFFINPETKAYLQELASEFDESSNGVRVELNRLSSAKLLKSEQNGRTVLYSANVEHSLFEEIRNVILKNVGIDKVIADVVERVGQVENAWITGDYARGVDSGIIDLLIVGNVNMDILLRASEHTGKLIHRKIRLLVLKKEEVGKYFDVLDLAQALPVWSTKLNVSAKSYS